MSGGRRHLGHKGARQRDIRRGEAELQAAYAARWDIVTRHAILKPRSAYAWLCRQSSGRRKPGYRSQAVAERVAGLLALLDGSLEFEPYRCHQAAGIERMGEHWHLKAVRGVELTPPDESGRIDLVTDQNGE